MCHPGRGDRPSRKTPASWERETASYTALLALSFLGPFLRLRGPAPANMADAAAPVLVSLVLCAFFLNFGFIRTATIAYDMGTDAARHVDDRESPDAAEADAASRVPDDAVHLRRPGV